MDFTTVIPSISALLTPYLPSLLSISSHIAKGSLEEIGKDIGGASFSYAKKIWHKLYPKIVHHQPDLEKISQEVENKDNYLTKKVPTVMERNSIKLGDIIQDTLNKNPQLATELLHLVKEAEIKTNEGRPFSYLQSMNIGSQVAEKIYNINHIEKGYFS